MLMLKAIFYVKTTCAWDEI